MFDLNFKDFSKESTAKRGGGGGGGGGVNIVGRENRKAPPQI